MQIVPVTKLLTISKKISNSQQHNSIIIKHHWQTRTAIQHLAARITRRILIRLVMIQSCLMMEYKVILGFKARMKAKGLRNQAVLQ